MKSFLNTRQYEILSALLKEDCPQTVEELSNSLHIKTRVIQYNLNAIDNWLKTNDARIIRRSGYGIHIDLPKKQRNTLLKRLSGLDNIELVLTTQERRRCLLLRMLSLDKPIASSRLGMEFGVSRTTITNDLSEVESWLKGHGLSLVMDPHRGFEIDGRRALKRFAICLLFCEEHFESQIPLGDAARLICSKQPFEYLMTDWFDFADLELAQENVSKVEGLLKVNYSQATRIFIHYYFLLLLADIRSHAQVTDEFVDSIGLFREILVLPFLREAIEGHTQEQVRESELHLLALHLHCQSTFSEPELEDETIARGKNSEYATEDLYELGSELVKDISLFLNPYLQTDQRFMTEIVGFLGRCLHYRAHGFSILNPFHEKARTLFSEIYDTTAGLCAKNAYLADDPLDETDISAITIITINALERIPRIAQRDIRVALISDADESLTYYTRERIISKFPWFKILGVFRTCDISQSKLRNVDLILSTSELNLDADHATITIDQFMTDQDVEHIKNWIDHNIIQKSSMRSPRHVELKDLLSERNIVFTQEVRDWKQAVYVVGRPLVEHGELSSGYLDAIIQANRTYGPYSVVAPHIALLHAKPTTGVNKLCLGLMILEKGVNFGSPRFDPVDLLFIVGIPDSHSHLHALYELANVIRTRSVYESLRRCGSAQDAIQIILSNSKRLK